MDDKVFNFNGKKVNTISLKDETWFDVYDVSNVVGNNLLFLIDNLPPEHLKKKNEEIDKWFNGRFEIIVDKYGLSYLLSNAEDKGTADAFRLWCNVEICKLPKETSIVVADDGGELIKTHENENGDILVEGRELYEFLNVRTKYNDWFNRMKGYGFQENIDFIAITQKKVTAQGNSTSYINHAMTLDMAKEISMIQRSDKGKQARQYFIKIENMWNTPEMVMKRALEFADKQVEQLKLENSEMKPKALFYDAVAASEDLIEVGDLACLLKKNGIDTGRTRLYEYLRKEKYLKSQSGTKNMPTQRSTNMDIMRETINTSTDRSGVTHINRKTMVTPKGQTYFVNKFLKEKEAK